MVAGKGSSARDRRPPVVLLVVLVLSASLPSWADGNLHLVVGKRCDASLGEFPFGLDCLTGDPEPEGGMDLRGGMVEGGRKGWPVRIEFALLWARWADFISTGSPGYPGVTYRWESRTAEMSVGVVRTWAPSGRWRLYVGGGLSALYAGSGRVADDFNDRRAFGAGLYAHGGGYVILRGSFHLGLDFRTLLAGELSYYHPSYGYSTSSNPEGTQIGLLVGYGWRARE